MRMKDPITLEAKWDYARIKDLIKNKDDIRIGPFGSSLSNRVKESGAYRVYGQWNIIANQFDLDKNYVDSDGYNELISYKVMPGDILISMMGTVGRCVVIPENIELGLMDSHVIKARLNTKKISPSFFCYVYDIEHSSVVDLQIQKEKKGSIMDGLNSTIVKRFSIPLPSLPEQERIVVYLDEKTAAIDTQVSLLEQKAKKYEQLKKSLISHAVTRGLNKDVRLKESGIDWIGQIPEDWSIVEIKHYCRSIFAGATPSTKEASYWDGDIPWLPSGACHDGIITEFNHTITEEGFANSSTKMIPANTTLMAMTGATCANTGYLTFESCANQSVCAYIENKKICNSKYLFYLLQAARKYILTFQTGGAQAGINLQDCSLLKVPCVPLSEQQAIADYLDKKTAEIDAAIANINQQIEKYKLLRRALINEVVTGQRAI